MQGVPTIQGDRISNGVHVNKESETGNKNFKKQKFEWAKMCVKNFQNKPDAFGISYTGKRGRGYSEDRFLSKVTFKSVRNVL